MSVSQETIYGDPDVKWGAGGFYNEGYVQRGSIEYGADNAQAKDSNGNVVTDVTYNRNAPVSFDSKRPGSNDGPVFYHIGLYVYKASALKRFVAAPVGVLEAREKLEQLRALENGMSVWVKVIPGIKLIEEAPPEINTPEELEEMRKFMK